MAVYRYNAINQAGKHISGEMEAQSREFVIRQLADAGHFPIDAAVANQGRSRRQVRCSRCGARLRQTRSRSSRASSPCCWAPA